MSAKDPSRQTIKHTEKYFFLGHDCEWIPGSGPSLAVLARQCVCQATAKQNPDAFRVTDLVDQNPSFVLRAVKDVAFEDRDIPKLRDEHEVRVQIAQTGICGSDVSSVHILTRWSC